MKKIGIITLLLLLGLSKMVAQEHERLITGRVIDEKTGETLPGATVVVKSSVRGAITNVDGEFTYKLTGYNIPQTVLVVSFIGYDEQEITVGDKSHFEIVLGSNFNSIQEVVITSSYGTKKLKQDVVGSITSVRTQDLVVESAVTSIDQLLDGQAAGLMIETGEGLDAPAAINIRGLGSLPNSSVGTSTQPLIIVDGVILTEEIDIEGSFEAGSGTYSEDPSNPLAKIGIKDIESINILKDAAAVSLYGADGANGVILITTKGGQAGKTRFSFGAQTGVAMVMDEIIYMTGEQYNDVYNTYLTNTGSLANPWNGVSTDWHGLLNENSVYQNYDFSISGGVENFNYRVSAAYQNTQETQINNTLDRFTSNIALNYKKDNFSVSWRISPSYSIRNTPNSLSDYPLDPTIAAYDSEGNYTPFDDYGNPIAVANQNLDKTSTFGIRNSLNLNYEILPGLRASTLFGGDLTYKEQDKFFSGENRTGVTTNDGLGRRIINDRKGTSWNWNATLAYEKAFAEKHHFDAIVGIETRLQRTEFDKYSGTGFDDFKSPQDISLASTEAHTWDSSEATGRSLFAQANYDFNKKYYILVNSRIDQSSAFGGDNNTSLNTAVGVSWVISGEDFMQDVRWIELLKIRSSYGSAGNSKIGSYSAKGLYNNYSTGYGGYNDAGEYANPQTAPNPNLGWESNYKFDAGIDLNTRFGLGLGIDFYNDDIRDMIVSRSVPLETGYSSVQINGADMYNRGLEFTMNYKIMDRNNFRWNTSFNISTLKNEVTSLKSLASEGSSGSSVYQTQIGTSATAIWGYNYVGVDPSTGRELYEVDGRIVDQNVLKSDYSDGTYKEVIGNTQPDYYGGLSNSFTVYKNIKLRVNLSYKIGGEMVVDDDKIDDYSIMSRSNMGINAYHQAWREAGDHTSYGSITERGTVTNSSKYMYSTSHIKLNNVSLSYNIPTNKVPFFDNLNCSLTGSNLYYWFFQESPEGQNGIKELYKNSPEMRTFTFGINASF